MMAKCTLTCREMNQRLDLILSECLMNTSAVDFLKCSSVFEDGSYKIHFSCDANEAKQVTSVEMYVNGEKTGYVSLEDCLEVVQGEVKYRDDILAGQPFLLHYDLLYLSFIVELSDGSSKEYFTDFLLCISKRKEDIINIQNMLRALSTFDNSQVNELMFSEKNLNNNNNLLVGEWSKRSYRSLPSYLQLLNEIIFVLQNNFVYFKMQGKHAIKRVEKSMSYVKAKRISRESFNWIIQNMEELTSVPLMSGIYYLGNNYLPSHIKAEVSRKSWDVYENKVIINFIYTVLFNAKQVYTEFNKTILDEVRIISKIHGSFPLGYYAPIITVKSLQISFYQAQLKKMNDVIQSLTNIFNNYESLFKISPDFLTSLPRKTSTFCEVKTYAKVFEIILRWFQYGEYSLEKEQLILHVKTLDKLFEYYCLFRILTLLTENGYQRTNSESSSYKYSYQCADEYYQNETDVPNTYVLNNGSNITATLYYQPVISATCFENNISLFRTTKRHIKNDYYTPDFILKFSEGNREEYVIFDAKFSSRKNIEIHSLPKVIQKYSCEISSASDFRPPKMVWILQGRVSNEEKPLWKYHNSLLARKYPPATTYGIVSINTSAGVNINQKLWNEIRNAVSII